MYPEALRENFGDLADFMLAPPDPSEIDDNGCFSTKAAKEVERRILYELSRSLSGLYFMEEKDRGKNPNNKWRTISCMQKAIRFGDRPMARFCASVGYDMDAKHVLRRLAITGLEDVGMGDMFGVLCVLAVMGSSHWRKACDERRLLVYLADRLAAGHGDRNLTDLLNASSFDTQIDKASWAVLTTEELLEVATTKGLHLQHRHIATWLAAGTKRYQGLNMPEDNDRPAQPLFRMMVEEGLPRAFLYGAAKTASRLADPFWACFYLTHEQVKDSAALTYIEDPVPPVPKIGKLLGAAYDMHTREGKEAIRRFCNASSAVKKFKGLTKNWNAYYFAVCEAIFYVEGGKLATRMKYRGSEELRATSWRTIMESSGLAAEHHQELFDTVLSELPLLNQYRENVLWESLNKA